MMIMIMIMLVIMIMIVDDDNTSQAFQSIVLVRCLLGVPKS